MNHTHENISRSQKIKSGSDRSFGVVFGIVFFIISVSPLLFSRFMRLSFLAVSVIFLAFAILEPSRLAALNRHWTRLGIILGAIVSPVILGILFFGVFLPTGLLLRLFGKDVLNLKWRRNDKSYWIMSGAELSSMKDQF
jgi:hypothetical protein